MRKELRDEEVSIDEEALCDEEASSEEGTSSDTESEKGVHEAKSRRSYSQLSPSRLTVIFSEIPSSDDCIFPRFRLS